MINFDIDSVKTPCYVVDQSLLEKNLQVLKGVSDKTGAKILLAQKAFSMYGVYPVIKEYLCGTAASGIFEAKLGYHEMGGEVHVFSPAYKGEDVEKLVRIADTIIFNSFSQWKKHKNIVLKADKSISCGIRINPEYSEIETDIYNPCFPGSRLGVTLDNFDETLLEGIEGLHFHTMCEQGADTLERTLKVVDKKFGKYLSQMK
ncbi:MAG: carboxynorspermidine decarboxylase, partial [Clostridiales bacterium]|nr:carboxynorspermidine decarboxylase [Clostridiales bacterium]